MSRSEDNILLLLSARVGPGNETQIHRLGGSCLYPLSHLASPFSKSLPAPAWDPACCLILTFLERGIKKVQYMNNSSLHYKCQGIGDRRNSGLSAVAGWDPLEGRSETEAKRSQEQPGGEPPPAALPEDAAGSGLDPAPTPGTLGHFRARSLSPYHQARIPAAPARAGRKQGPRPWEGGRVPGRRGWEGTQLGHIWSECGGTKWNRR